MSGSQRPIGGQRYCGRHHRHRDHRLHPVPRLLRQVHRQPQRQRVGTDAKKLQMISV